MMRHYISSTTGGSQVVYVRMSVICDELLQSCAEFIVMCLLREAELLQII